MIMATDEFRLEPLYGVWLMQEQVSAVYDWFNDEDGMLTLTDLRDRSVELNLPPEIKDDISDFRGSVLVEQEDGSGVRGMAVIDRHGHVYPLEPNQVRALTEREQLQQLVKHASAVLREIHEQAHVCHLDYGLGPLGQALNAWDEFVQAIEPEEEG